MDVESVFSEGEKKLLGHWAIVGINGIEDANVPPPDEDYNEILKAFKQIAIWAITPSVRITTDSRAIGYLIESGIKLIEATERRGIKHRITDTGEIVLRYQNGSR